MTSFWRIVSPKTRKQLYTTLSTDAYDPNSADRSSLAAVSWYSQIMRGPGTRMTSYKQYDAMDADIDISRSLDIIAEEMSGKDDKTNLPFLIEWQKEDNQDVSDTTIVTVRAALRQWSQIQDLKKRVFRTARTMIKHGDCFFRKASDTRKWMYVDPTLIVGIEIDEMGTKIAYHVKKAATQQLNTYGMQRVEDVDIVPAAAMIHFTLSDDMGDSAPFGQSVLKPIFRVYRQLSMLEDAVIIYRIVRAPERRAFYIDVGNMNQQQVKRYLESVKNEIRQKRVPGQNGGMKDSVDGAYDPMCLSMDTEVPLLDGRTLTIQELATEHQEGKQNWVYSCDPVSGEIKPGEIVWAGSTRKNAEVLELTLDNGEKIVCTPDHKFPVQGLGFVRADELTNNMSLVPFNRRYKSTVGEIQEQKFHQGYEELYDVHHKKWVQTHRMIGQHMVLENFTYQQSEALSVLHHLDFNKHNNLPSNLVRMGFNDHTNYHAAHNAERFKSWSEEKQSVQVQALHAGLQTYWDSVSSGGEKARSTAIHEANALAGKTKTVRRKSNYGPAISQRLQVSQEMIGVLVDFAKRNPKARRTEFLKHIQTDAQFLTAFRAVNTSTTSGRRSTPSWTVLEVMKEMLNAGTMVEFREKLISTNHKIVSIKVLPRQDVGCITVGEGVHNHHTFALKSGIFTKNSLQEDYFFPVTAGGKGSRVETLPGGTEDFGTNLLKTFTEKIFRGLRIPTSYISGSDASGAGGQTNDGKVGIAYIEELRFANFISRMQDNLNEIYDQEFKIYLKVCGLRIDDEVFNIRLPDPANFALYRQAALDADLIASFQNIQEVQFLSRRFILKRYLGLSDDEIQMNEVMLKEEKNMTDNATVSIMQQMYDDAVYKNRATISVNADEVAPGGGGTDEFDSDPGAGLLDSDYEDKPFASSPSAEPEAAEETPPEGEEPAA